MQEQALLMEFGLILVHAFTHLGVHDAKERIERYVHRPERLSNHDVRKAVERTVQVVVQRLQTDYKQEFPKDRGAVAAFAALENAAFDTIGGNDAGPADQWLKQQTVSASFSVALDRFAPEASVEVRRFVAERFAPLFVFAFREIGLKGDDKVRALIFEAMLQRLDQSDTDIQSLLLKHDEVMRTQLNELGFDVTNTKTSVAEVLSELRALRVAVESGRLGAGPPLAYLRIEDFDGVTLRTEPICNPRFTVGREVDVNLDDIKVSRLHAVFSLTKSGALVQDRSTNGTFVRGQRIMAPCNVDFGTPVQVGGFRLYLLSPDTDPMEFLPDGTE